MPSAALPATSPDAPGVRQLSDAARANPWTVASNAIAQLRRGGPDQLRVLIARAMGGLGLPELAEEWADTVPQTPELAPLIAQIRAALPALNRSERPASERIAMAHANMRLLPSLAEQLAPFAEGWARRQSARRWFRANDGQWVIVERDLPADHPRCLVRFGDEHARCAARCLPPNQPDSAGPPPPILLDGLRGAESLADLCGRYPRLENHAWARLLVIETDPDAVLDALSERDLGAQLSQDRLRIFAGPGAKDRAAAFLRDRIEDWSSVAYFSDRAEGPDRQLLSRIKELETARATEYRGLLARNHAAYADRTAAWWADRYRRAIGADSQPLRALVVTTRYSTYIQHASRDLCAAFESAGVDARLVIEPDDCSRTDGLRIARAIDSFRPDIFVVINYTRGQFADAVPRQIPHCCWVQDAMPHLFTRSAGADIDHLSIVVGGVFREFVETHRYPRRACLLFDVPALARSFRAEPRRTCEIDVLIATNHGETPKAMAARLDRECAGSGGPAGLVTDIHDALTQGLGRWTHGFLIYWIEDTLRPVLERRGYDPNGDSARAVIRDAALPLVNRMLRHRVIGWADRLAREHGWTLAIAGRGWEDHPTLGRHAIGEVRHGPELRDLYTRSLITLHASSAWIFHQRIYESLLAGSLPAMLFKPDDLTGLLRPARVLTRQGLAPTSARLSDRRLCVHALDHPVGALALCLAQRFAPANAIPQHPGRNQDAERTLESGQYLWRDGADDQAEYIAELHRPEEHVRFMWSVADGFFRDQDELRDLIQTCRTDPQWRVERIRHARSIVEQSFTLERAAREMVGFMRKRIEEASTNA